MENTVHPPLTAPSSASPIIGKPVLRRIRIRF